MYNINNCEKHILDKFIENIECCINKVKDENYKDLGKSIYGSTQKINNDKIVEDLAKEYIKNLSN